MAESVGAGAVTNAAASRRHAIVVAPREITDLVLRASRVVGCEASIADRIAADVLHSEIHDGCGLEEFLRLAEHDPRGLDRAAAAAVVPRDDTPLLLRRRSEHRPSADSEARERAAFGSGVAVAAEVWTHVAAVAANFLLSESILDDAGADD